MLAPGKKVQYRGLQLPGQCLDNWVSLSLRIHLHVNIAGNNIFQPSVGLMLPQYVCLGK